MSGVAVVGHAGNGLEIPSSIYHSNSLESIELALGTVGVEGVEVDVQLSADGELWLLHDNQLEVETNGKGCVSELTFDELKTIHYKTVNKEKLVRLIDLNFSTYAGKTFYLDMRHYNVCSETLVDKNQLLDALSQIADKWGHEQFVVLLNYKNWLNDVSAAGWKVCCEIEQIDEVEVLNQYNVMYDGIIIRNAAVTKEQIEQIKSENKTVILFDIRAPKPIRQALKKSPDAIVVDDLKTALIEKSN